MSKAECALEWKAERGIREMCRDAWRWERKMNWAFKLFNLLIEWINLIAAIITVAFIFQERNVSIFLVLCVCFRIFSTILLYIRWLKDHSKLQTLRILAS